MLRYNHAFLPQVDVHAAYGGVVPNLAMEAHKAAMDTCVEEALQQAGITAQDLQAVAVSIGPGLSPCLQASTLYTSCISGCASNMQIGTHHCLCSVQCCRLTHPFSGSLWQSQSQRQSTVCNPILLSCVNTASRRVSWTCVMLMTSMTHV